MEQVITKIDRAHRALCGTIFGLAEIGPGAHRDTKYGYKSISGLFFLVVFYRFLNEGRIYSISRSVESIEFVEIYLEPVTI